MPVAALRSLFVLLVFSLFLGCASAQPGPAQVPALTKKEQKIFAEARSAFDLGRYAESGKLLDELLSRNATIADAHYLRGLVYRQLGQYEAALAALQTGRGADPSPSPTLYVELGQLHAQLGKFDKSLEAYRKYRAALGNGASPERLRRADGRVQRAEIAATLAARPVPYSASPLSGGVNTTEHLEYFPSLSADGSYLIFTRRVGRQNEDFYRSEKQEDGSWSVAVPLEGVNTEFNEGAQTISADGNLLVFTACERPVNEGSCDLYYSERVPEGGWTPARSVGRGINTTADESQPSLSADGNLLFFSSNRAGGQGGKDLYVSAHLPDGEWSVPSNLGPTVNTPGNEQYPFWAADGRSLYFTSDHHPGLGGEDLFRTDITPQNTWSAPVNLGFPINTADDETNLFIGLDGKTAYFSKRFVQPGTGYSDVDIYSFQLPQNLRPAPATYLEATVVDAKTGAPLKATVRLSTVSGKAPATSLMTDETGQFLTVLPSGEDYALTVEQPGYLYFSERFTLTGDLVPEEPFRYRIELQPVEDAVVAGGTEPDGSVVFRNVLFESGSATLLPVSGQELDLLVSVLATNPGLRVTIAGHTDDVGEEDDNQRLSEARAAAVAAYLTGQGIAADRIETVGYGESRPVADNATPEGRAENRRTTFKLLR